MIAKFYKINLPKIIVIIIILVMQVAFLMKVNIIY